MVNYILILLIVQKTKKPTINPINKKDKCFQYAVTVVLNHEEITKDLHRITKIKPFIKKYNWEGLNFLYKAPFITYADLECLIKKMDGCENNPQNSLTTKVGERIPSGFPMFAIASLKSIEHKHDV